MTLLALAVLNLAWGGQLGAPGWAPPTTFVLPELRRLHFSEVP